MTELERFALSKRIGLAANTKEIADVMRRTREQVDSGLLTPNTEVSGVVQDAMKHALLDNKMPAYYSLASLQTSPNKSINATFIGLAMTNGRFPLFIPRDPLVDAGFHLVPHEEERLSGLFRIWSAELRAFDITLVVPANLHADWSNKCDQVIEMPKLRPERRTTYLRNWVAQYMRTKAIEMDLSHNMKDALVKLLAQNEFMNQHRHWAGPNPPMPRFQAPKRD